MRRLTPEGEAENHRRAYRVVAARADAAFQQFKTALVIEPRKGRRKAAC